MDKPNHTPFFCIPRGSEKNSGHAVPWPSLARWPPGVCKRIWLLNLKVGWDVEIMLWLFSRWSLIRWAQGIHKIHKIHKPCPDPRIDPCWDPENMLIPVFGLLWHDGYPKQCGEVFNPSTAGSIKSVKGHVQTKYAVPSHSMLSFDDLFVWLDFPVMWWLT